MTLTRTDRATTPWASGRFDTGSGEPRLLFGRTFEDPAIEGDLFPVDGEVVCIASAGDTASALATAGRSVIAVDINPVQLAEVRRRLQGHAPRDGAADRLLRVGRAALAPAGWRRARLERFCQLDDLTEQAEEWRRLTPPVVRAAARAALSPKVLRLAYGAPFARLAPVRFGERLLDRIGSRITMGPNRDNPWLARLLTGAWTRPDPTTGHERVTLRGGDVAAVLEALPSSSLDGISLSNVLDGPGPAYADRLLTAAHRAGRPGAPIVIRSFLDAEDAQSRRLADLDRSLVWGGITVHHA
jgi:hypothetical protein